MRLEGFDVTPFIVANQIKPYLYLSSEYAAANLELLLQRGITHIVNAATAVDNYFPNLFTYKRIQISDLPTENIKQYFGECNDFINEARYANGKCLVHCNAGVSRSATIVMAYLIKYECMSVEHALSYVQERRSIVSPNNGFLLQLFEYEAEVQGTS
uniref:Protein-tyrosine-phosphatase n=1 Tax=Trichuris muris TaxID=70415 RepID=A0A5S6QDX0_TRIMR